MDACLFEESATQPLEDDVWLEVLHTAVWPEPSRYSGSDAAAVGSCNAREARGFSYIILSAAGA